MNFIKKIIEKREEKRRKEFEKNIKINRNLEIRLECLDVCHHLINLRQNLEISKRVNNEIPTLYEIELLEKCPIFVRILEGKVLTRKIQEHFLSGCEEISPQSKSLRDFFIDVLSNNKIDALMEHIDSTINWAKKLEKEISEKL